MASAIRIRRPHGERISHEEWLAAARATAGMTASGETTWSVPGGTVKTQSFTLSAPNGVASSFVYSEPTGSVLVDPAEGDIGARAGELAARLRAEAVGTDGVSHYQPDGQVVVKAQVQAPNRARLLIWAFLLAIVAGLLARLLRG